MNQIFVIGNLTRDPELRTIPSGTSVCNFTIAVNRRRGSANSGNQPDADFFRISAWGAVGENCNKYLKKGSKVAVVGQVSAHAFMGADGTARASLEISTNEVEFLSSRAGSEQQSYNDNSQQSVEETNNGFSEIDETELPF